MEKATNNKHILLTVALAILVAYSLTGIGGIVIHQLGVKFFELGNLKAFDICQNDLWEPMSRFVLFVPIFGAIPYLVLNIAGMIREKNYGWFIVCILFPVFIWFLVLITAAAYF